MVKGENRPADCAHVLGKVAALREEMNSPIPPRDRVEYETAVEAARNALGGEMFAALSKDGWISSPRKLDELMREAGIGLPVQ